MAVEVQLGKSTGSYREQFFSCRPLLWVLGQRHFNKIVKGCRPKHKGVLKERNFTLVLEKQECNTGL